MSDLRTRLRDHIDQAAPPLDVEELVAALVEDSTLTIPSPGSGTPQPRFTLRPVWVAVLTVIAVVGWGLFAWLLREDRPETEPASPQPPVTVKTFEPDAAALGTIEISIRGWSGVDGYQLLATVWEDSMGTGELVGGAFWTLVDDDPFSATDTIHPPVDPAVNTRTLSIDQWGLEDYQWDQNTWLEPGEYEIVFWANPEILHPYGSHIPRDPIERSCVVTVEVEANKVTSLAITGVPSGFGECALAPSERLNKQVAVTVTGFQGHAGWDMAGVLYRGTDLSFANAIGGFAAEVDSDDFMTTQFIREGQSDTLFGFDSSPFPFVKEERLVVEPGLHSLVIWASNKLGPYSRWTPALTPGGELIGCEVVFEVVDGEQTRINIDGSSLTAEVGGDDWTCVTKEQP